MKWTYRKVLNKGFTPCWYKTDHGSRIAWVEKTEASGCVRFASDNLRKRLPLSEQLRVLKSKRG